eukprot:358276-Chlamydomonas_euryale.AAC.3
MTRCGAATHGMSAHAPFMDSPPALCRSSAWTLLTAESPLRAMSGPSCCCLAGLPTVTRAPDSQKCCWTPLPPPAPRPPPVSQSGSCGDTTTCSSHMPAVWQRSSEVVAGAGAYHAPSMQVPACVML